MPPADDAEEEGFDGPQTVPGMRSSQRTTLPLPAPLEGAPDGHNDWPNDAVRPMWDREVTVAREAPLSDEAKALLRGDEPPTEKDVLAALDQAGPPVSHTPTLAGIPAVEIPVVQSGPSTLTGIPARETDEFATPEEMPASAAELAAVPVVELGLQATIRMPEQSPADEFVADDRTPLPSANVPFGGSDSGINPMPTPPDGPGQEAGQVAVAGLIDNQPDHLAEVLKNAEPDAPEIVPSAAAASNSGEPVAMPAHEFDQAPSTAPGIIIGDKFIPGIRDMMPQRDENEEEGTDSGSEPHGGDVRGYIPFESSGVSRPEEFPPTKPAVPRPEAVFPAPPPLPPDVIPKPIPLSQLARVAGAHSEPAPATEMTAAEPPIPVAVPPSQAEPPVEMPPSGDSGVVQQAVAKEPEAVLAPLIVTAPVPEPTPPPVPAPAPVFEPIGSPAPAGKRVVMEDEPDYTEIMRGLKRKNTLRILPWAISAALALIIVVAVGLGARLYSVRQTDTDAAEYNEAMTSCIRERTQRSKEPVDKATRACMQVADRLLNR